jgi:hypothetical protein
MSAFPDWQQYIVKQKREETGCIPTGYEMILRAAGKNHVAFDTFQEEFDLDRNLKFGDLPRNDFESVARAIQTKYPDVRFEHIGFPQGDGLKKLEVVEHMISQTTPILISLALAPFGGREWHIMPVVDASTDSLTLFWGVNVDGTPNTKTLTKADFVHIHNNYCGGDDVAFLQQCIVAPKAFGPA